MLPFMEDAVKITDLQKGGHPTGLTESQEPLKAEPAPSCGWSEKGMTEGRRDDLAGFEDEEGGYEPRAAVGLWQPERRRIQLCPGAPGKECRSLCGHLETLDVGSTGRQVTKCVLFQPQAGWFDQHTCISQPPQQTNTPTTLCNCYRVSVSRTTRVKSQGDDSRWSF